MQDIDLQVHFASYLKNHLGYFARRYGRKYSMHFIIDAHSMLMIDQKAFEMSGSWLWLGYPGPLFEQVAGMSLPRGHYRVSVSGGYIDALLEQGLWPREPLPIRDVVALSACFEVLLQRLQGATALHQRQRAHAIEACLFEAWAQQDQAPQQALWLENCCSYLTENACEGINYHFLAGDLGIPLPTLRRNFRKAMGLPMHRYVIEQRCQEVQKLLLETDHSITDIAEILAYDDVAYLSKQFKAVTGLSPSEFRVQRYF